MKVETYILGQGKAPQWLNDEAGKGRVKFIRDDEGNLLGAKIMSGTKVYDAKVGDSIIKSNSGLVAMPQDKAKKYGVQNGKVHKEDIKSE